MPPNMKKPGPRMGVLGPGSMFFDKDKTTTGDKAGRRSHLHAPPNDEDEDTFNACKT
jgi:hypothetical protein